jgi:hypothetical protein
MVRREGRLRDLFSGVPAAGLFLSIRYQGGAMSGRNLKIDKKDYIGDGVYCRFDGSRLELRANDYFSPSDTIILEPEVLAGIIRFAKANGMING